MKKATPPLKCESREPVVEPVGDFDCCLWSRGIDYASFRPTPDWSLIRDEVWVDEGVDCD